MKPSMFTALLLLLPALLLAKGEIVSLMGNRAGPPPTVNRGFIAVGVGGWDPPGLYTPYEGEEFAITADSTFWWDVWGNVSRGANTGCAGTGDSRFTEISMTAWQSLTRDPSCWDAVAAGGCHTLALRDGVISANGNNDDGQLNVPEPNSGYRAIAAGGLYAPYRLGWSVAIDSAGYLVAWGNPSYANIPDGRSGFIAVSAGTGITLALHEDGSVIGWGPNGYRTDAPAPNTDFIAITAGANHSFGIKSDGSIVAWPGNWNIPAPNYGFTAVAATESWVVAIRGAPEVAHITLAPALAIEARAYPNPFSIVTHLSGMTGEVSIYSVTGREVRRLDGPTWNAAGVAPGVYYAKAGQQVVRLVKVD